MKRCFELASKGHPKAYPNPLVGCVIVANDIIIGEGFHTKYGEPHAEVEAIQSVKDKSLLAEACLYVNLEPCAHYGKTPPCADLIIENNIPNVVISNVDPHDKVAGKGIAKLRSAGIKVETDVLKEQGHDLNKRFMTFHAKKRPYIILKWAETADGFIGRNYAEQQKSKAISNELANIYVHQLRAASSAIFVGTNTAIVDNPRLTTRLFEGKNPLRVVIDTEGKIPETHHIFTDGNATVVLGQERHIQGIEYIPLQKPSDLFQVLSDTLYTRQIDQVLIEGGAKILNQCIEKGYWDEMHVIQAGETWDKGIAAPSVGTLTPTKELKLDDNTVKIYRNR